MATQSTTASVNVTTASENVTAASENATTASENATSASENDTSASENATTMSEILNFTQTNEDFNLTTIRKFDQTEDCSHYDLFYHIITFFAGSLIIFGLVGNTLSFLVFQQRQSKKSSPAANFLLQALAIADNFMLVTWANVISRTIARRANVDLTDTGFEYFMRLALFAMWRTSHLVTIWITVLIAFNRYIAICKPFRAGSICTVEKIRIQVVVTLVFCVLFNIPRFLETRIDTYYDQQGQSKTKLVQRAFDSTTAYNIGYKIFLKFLIYYCIPFLLLLMFNVCLIRGLRKAQKMVRGMNVNVAVEKREENNVTYVMILIITVFLISQFAYFINEMAGTILWYYFNDRLGCLYYAATFFTYLLLIFNGSINFVIYGVARKQFRQQLKILFGCAEVAKKDRPSSVCSDTTQL